MTVKLRSRSNLSGLSVNPIIAAIIVVLVVCPATVSSSLRSPGISAYRPPVDWNSIIESNKTRPAAPAVDWRSHLLLAIAYANTGQFTKTNEELRLLSSGDYRAQAETIIIENTSVLASRPDDILALNYIAFAYYSLQKDRESARAFERLLEVDPSNVWMRHYLAYLYTRLDRLDDAIKTLKDALEIDPQNEYTHLLLGLAYQKKGWPLAAIVEFLKAPNARREAVKLWRE